jgi:hypothetical protein
VTHTDQLADSAMMFKLIDQFKHDRINLVFVQVQFQQPRHLRHTFEYSTAMREKLLNEGIAQKSVNYAVL